MDITVRKLGKSKSSKVCLMSDDIFRSLGIKAGLTYKLNVGLLSTTVTFTADKTAAGQLTIGSMLSDRLKLMDNIKLNIWREKQNIYLGPVVGIFSSGRNRKALERGEVPTSLQIYKKVNQISNCLFYSFGSNDINWNDRSINGWVFDTEENKWAKRWLPMPNVVYNYMNPPDIIAKFESYKNVHFIYGHHGFDKWSTHERFSQIDEMKKYLPETVIYKSFEDVMEMLKKYNYIFLKAVHGSQGRKDVSVANENNKYVVNYYDVDLKKINIVYFDNQESLKQMILHFFKSEPFVVQQGLRLSDYYKRKFDLRILMQKDGTGQWQTVNYCARVAAEEVQITNTSSGGEYFDYNKIYEYHNTQPDKNYLPTKEELKKIAMEIIGVIEREYGSYGEVGLDIGIDKTGKFLFIFF